MVRPTSVSGCLGCVSCLSFRCDAAERSSIWLVASGSRTVESAFAEIHCVVKGGRTVLQVRMVASSESEEESQVWVDLEEGTTLQCPCPDFHKYLGAGINDKGLPSELLAGQTMDAQ